MKNNILAIVILLLTLFCIVLLCLLFYVKKADTIREKHSLCFKEQLSDNTCLNTKTRLLTSQKDTITLNEVVNDREYFLVFKYSDSMCGGCVLTIISKLNQMREDISCLNILLFVHYSSFREMRFHLQSIAEYNLPSYFVEKNSIGLPIDNENVPYFIFIDDGELSKHTFIVDLEHLERVDEYLQNIAYKYCHNK